MEQNLWLCASLPPTHHKAEHTWYRPAINCCTEEDYLIRGIMPRHWKVQYIQNYPGSREEKDDTSALAVYICVQWYETI